MVKSGIVALVLFCGAANAEASDFIGHWENPNPKARGLTHVAISPNGGDRVDVRAYGDCRPSECDWGLVQGKIYTGDPKSNSVEVIVATFHFGFAHHQITFRKGASGRLAFEMLTDFADGSDKHDYAVNGNLKQTAWAGPITQVWQKPPGLTTGWGGGARGGASPKPAETCKVYDIRGARAVEQNGMWKVIAAGQTLVDAGHDDKAAMIAEATIRHYGLDRRCTVGGPWNTYWKAGDGFPREKTGGIVCQKFNPTTVHLIRMGRDWAIVDGVTTIGIYGDRKQKAEATLDLIRYQRFVAQCFVRQPDPLMAFWLAD